VWSSRAATRKQIDDVVSEIEICYEAEIFLQIITNHTLILKSTHLAHLSAEISKQNLLSQGNKAFIHTAQGMVTPSARSSISAQH
jgi:hypothetical protein